MPGTEEALALRGILDDLNAVQMDRLVRLWRSISDREPAAIRDALLVEFPLVVDEFSSIASDVTATWYAELDEQSLFEPVPVPAPPAAQATSTVRWAAGGLFTPAGAPVVDVLAGAAQRYLFNASRDTVLTNIDRERGATWARYASSNACPFCRMLATRGEVFASKEAATTVGRGGRGRVRGTQSAGDRFHDHCRCVAVPVRPGKSYQPPSYVEEWTDQYNTAVGQSDGSTKGIMQAWRKLA